MVLCRGRNGWVNHLATVLRKRYIHLLPLFLNPQTSNRLLSQTLPLLEKLRRTLTGWKATRSTTVNIPRASPSTRVPWRTIGMDIRTQEKEPIRSILMGSIIHRETTATRFMVATDQYTILSRALATATSTLDIISLETLCSILRPSLKR